MDEIQGLELHLVWVGGSVSKTEACRGLNVYIDDDLDKFEPIVHSVQHRYLFSWGCNKHIEVPASIAKRVNFWQHFYEEVSSL
jgi:hypothetical protein